MIAFSPIFAAPATVLLRSFFTAPPAPSVATRRSKNVVIIYDDRAAGNRAVGTLTGLQAQSAGSTHLSPIPWSFDLLTELSWRSRAIRDIDRADLAIISLSEPDEIPVPIKRWIDTCLHRERATSIPVILQFADGEVWTIGPANTGSGLESHPPTAASSARPASLHPARPACFPFVRLSAHV